MEEMFCVFLYNVFSQPLIFTLLAASISHFMFFTAAIISSSEIGLPCFFIPPSYSSLSVFHVNVDSKIDLGLPHMRPVTGTNFALAIGSCEKFQPGFGDEKWPKILETSSGAKVEKQSRHGETKILTFAPIILAPATLKAVSLQLNEMLMKEKIQ